VKILALDTATELCSAALWIDGECRTRQDARPRGSGELILGMIEELLAESSLTLAGLDAIAVGRGPGGFTGVRLAVAVAQGLAFAAELPLLPVSELRALAHQALSQDGVPERALICQDARMGQVYWCCYERLPRDAAGHRLTRECRAEALDFPQRVHLPAKWVEAAQAVCGAGSGFEAYPLLRELPGMALGPIFGALRPRAQDIAALAAQDGLSRALAPEAVQPVYLRDQVAALPSRN
jgi:tRNA threonylcarbamoyladenosine biosynthesis protein TsaB